MEDDELAGNKEKSEGPDKAVIVLGVIGADCHAVGNQVLHFFFKAAGFKVVNLGVMVSQDEFIDAAIETGAEAILVSSLYGHGEIDCAGFRDRCVERGLEHIILYVGGNLVIGKHDFAEIEQQFKSLGFDRAFHADSDLHKAAELLKGDIIRNREASQNMDSNDEYSSADSTISAGSTGSKIPTESTTSTASITSTGYEESKVL